MLTCVLLYLHKSESHLQNPNSSRAPGPREDDQHEQKRLQACDGLHWHGRPLDDLRWHTVQRTRTKSCEAGLDNDVTPHTFYDSSYEA